MLPFLTPVRRAGLAALVAAATVATGLATAPAATADTAPEPPVTVPTVSADALPTVQINGVAYDQVVVGNRVYVTGEFTSARPAGSPAGSNETPRSNILAYDLTTGALVASWAPSLNAVGKAIAASADGSRIFVAGSFTQVSGVNRFRIAALDANTGAVVSSWSPGTNARVTSLAVSGGTVYLGGIFTSVNSSSRTRLAAVSATSGAVLAWAPTADQEVMALAAPAGSGKVVAGGRFTTLNGQDWYGMGALDATTGANLPWAATSTVRNAGSAASIYSLSTDGPQVYGTGYTFGNGGNFEGTFAASSADGTLAYVTGCRGDTYDAAPVGGVLYHVGHPHDCAMVGGNPQTEPWSFQRAYAQTITAAPDGAVNQGGNFSGRPAPELLHWLPTLDVGSYTGTDQAAWTVAGNSDYVVLGGEFPRVNGTAQQGLVRFAVRGIAPNRQGPQGGVDLTPTLLALEPGRVRVSWRSAWDRDNRRLTYEVMRGTPLANAQVIATMTKDTAWWDRPAMSFTDTTAPAGTSQTYRIRVRDALGNVVQGNPASVDVPAGSGTTSPYRDVVRQDGAQALWPLNEGSGTAAYDYAGANDVTLGANETRGATGALIGDTSKATTFAGDEQAPGVSSDLVTGPMAFTIETWFRTTTTSGGKLVGFGNSSTGISSNYDRHVYLTNDGRIVFGAHPGGVRTLTSTAAYNDGQWHQVVAAVGPDRGMELFLDGKRIGRDAGVTGAQPFSGYWRLGGDNLDGWPNQPASRSFAGDLDEVAIYPTALPLDRVQAHYLAGGRTLNLPTRPADAYGAAVWDANPSLFWRLDETSGTSALDRMTNEPGGTASGGVVRGEAGGPMWTGGASARLPGGWQTIVANSPVDNPTTFSEEVWFKTTTTDGGRIIGFGNAGAGGMSGNYDRHVYMLNDGRLRFGIWTGSASIVDSSAAYNDGAWHHLVATQGPDGQKLYVDGALAGQTGPVTPQNYVGHWRIGGDNTWGGANTNDFAGSIDEVAVYDSVLSPSTISQHWFLGAPNVLPTAAFTSECTGLACEFDGSGSSDVDGTPETYAWQFGDGGTATGVSPEHTYAASGTYDVALTVTDDEGGSRTVTHQVTVAEPPNQAPTAAFGSDCTGLGCAFDAADSADADGSVASYDWQFGDGESGSGVSPDHTYAAAGSYDVVLTVTDDDGATATVTHTVTVAPPNQAPAAAFAADCTNLACEFDAAASADADGSIASYAWEFGDGETGTGVSPDHTYTAGGTYDVELTVTDDDGQTATVTHGVTVEPANTGPQAAFDSDCTGLACAFDSSGSTDADGTITTRAWDFGDGETGTGATPSHTYDAAGTYTVTLTVTDDDGATGTVSHPVTVAVPNSPPVSRWSSDCTALACTFDGTASGDADGSVVSWSWAFGDGQTGTGAAPSHTYAGSGSYDVVLTVTDDDGATAQVTHTVNVTAANQAPVARFTSGGANLAWTFDGGTSSDADGSVVSYAWAYGDGQTGAGATSAHTYAVPGTYTVTLTVTDDDGTTGSTTHTVTATAPPANDPPTAAFTASCVNLVCALDAGPSSDADGDVTGYAWAFGDGGSATGETTSHTYAAPGTYAVTLTVTDDDGATASTTRNVTVTGAPAAQTLASDGFGRAVASGWGTADTGGAWTFSGAGTSASVADGAGRVSLPAGRTAILRLGGVSNLDTDLSHLVWTDGMPTGGGVYLGSTVRSTATGDYRARLRLQANGVVNAGFVRGVGSSETAVGSAPAVPGLTYTAGTRLRLRVQAEGASPTTLRLKVWRDGTAEPAAWTATTTDATAGYQVAGAVGLVPYASGSATAATAVRYDDVVATTIGAPAQNQPPVAAFTSSCSGLTCAFNGNGSSDPDGAVTGYAWSFGDASSGAGATASRTYAAPGTYTVTLTATDDDGATRAVSHQVTVTAPANLPPSAAFTSACTGLTCTVDAGDATDADGAVVSYAWAFGDGGTGTGEVATHTYPAAGTYDVTLTVTDDDGATTAVTHQVSPAAANVLASDAFGRTVAAGLGTADTGGAWTTSGTAAVGGGDGRFTLNAGWQGRARLAGVSSQASDVTHTVWLDAVPTGGGIYLGTTVRGTGGGDYRARLRVQSTGVVSAHVTRVTGSTETALAGGTVTGLTYTPGLRLHVRAQAVGASPTTIRMKVWAAGDPEPAAWRYTATDATAALQGPGSVGVDPYLSGSATAGAVAHYDDLAAVRL